MTTLNIALSNTLEANTISLFSREFALGATLELNADGADDETLTVQEDAATIERRLRELEQREQPMSARQTRLATLLHGDAGDTVEPTVLSHAQPSRGAPSWGMMLSIFGGSALVGVLTGVVVFLV